MMAFSAKSLRLLSLVHVVFGILAMAAGIASMKVTDYYSGLFGMGIWLGSWVLLTGLAGIASSKKPGNFCRIGIFLGCCLVAIVILSICSIIVGTVVIQYFHFESTVTRDFYEGKGTFGQKNHDDFYKPEKYFEDRREGGRIGLAVYGFLLAFTICDVLLCCASVYVCRDLTRNEQAANARGNRRNVSVSRHSQGNAGAVPIAELGHDGQNWAELVFQGMPQSLQPMPVHFMHNQDYPFFIPYKLPNYTELYPEGIVNSSVAQNDVTRISSVPVEPPPAYTPTADPSLCQHSTLPGSSVEFHLNSVPLPTEENATVEESTSSVRTLTVEHTSVPETTGVLELSSEHLRLSELPSDYPGSSTPVHSLHLGDSESSLSFNSLPNSIQLSALEDLNRPVSSESQNDTMQSENVNTITQADGSETR